MLSLSVLLCRGDDTDVTTAGSDGAPFTAGGGVGTFGGSLGLLFPPSLPILVYALVAGLDFELAFRAGLDGTHRIRAHGRQRIPAHRADRARLGP